VQWFEHGRPIDRFEGVYRRGKREGFGRYDWPTGERFEGTYADDLPTGRGALADLYRKTVPKSETPDLEVPVLTENLIRAGGNGRIG
jgi:MORN repeat